MDKCFAKAAAEEVLKWDDAQDPLRARPVSTAHDLRHRGCSVIACLHSLVVRRFCRTNNNNLFASLTVQLQICTAVQDLAFERRHSWHLWNIWLTVGKRACGQHHKIKFMLCHFLSCVHPATSQLPSLGCSGRNRKYLSGEANVEPQPEFLQVLLTLLMHLPTTGKQTPLDIRVCHVREFVHLLWYLQMQATVVLFPLTSTTISNIEAHHVHPSFFQRSQGLQPCNASTDDGHILIRHSFFLTNECVK
mmetsp:Transcript_102054/g.195923  ORF Transcript_102054/g.195923 Transcript_102054/m.195923 type:complete len:248 (+) Transcript_102054:1003-1746(+)